MPPAADTQSVLSQNTVSSAGGARSIYPRGPTFSLDTFAVRFLYYVALVKWCTDAQLVQTKDFVVKDFVESLTESAAPATARASGVNSGQSMRA